MIAETLPAMAAGGAPQEKTPEALTALQHHSFGLALRS